MAHGRLITAQSPERLARFAFGGDPLAVDLGDAWVSGDEIARLRKEPFVVRVRRTEEGLMVVVEDGEAGARELQRLFSTAGIEIGGITPMEPTFDDIFFEIVEAHSTAAQRAAA
jgi:hypothetical protein